MIKIIFLIIISFCSNLLSASSKEDKNAKKIITDLGIKEINELKRSIQTKYLDIYVDSNGYALNISLINTSLVKLPIKIYYEGDSICSIACLTNNKKESLFIEDKVYFIIGFIQIKGSYDQNNKCIPYGEESTYYNTDTYNEDFSFMCKRDYPDFYKKSDNIQVYPYTGRFF